MEQLAQRASAGRFPPAAPLLALLPAPLPALVPVPEPLASAVRRPCS
jgi:hypothetical protein|tara:strand:+ start:516 stop:656 length:141 start_codon:yes stop_codon:yes gene_type:complete